MLTKVDCDDGSAAAFGWHDGGYGMTSAFSLFVAIAIGADDERPCEWWWWLRCRVGYLMAWAGMAEGSFFAFGLRSRAC